jgi:hypothetical protein
MKRDIYAIFVGLTLSFGIFYFTWCWGMWGRDNILMRYLFQCACPRSSEQARFSPFKVVASACIDPSFLDLSPNEQYALVAEMTDNPKIIRVDLENGENKIVDFVNGVAFFLTDDLMLVVNNVEQTFFLVDLSDGFRTQLYPEDDLEKALTKTKTMEKVWVEFLGFVVGLNENYKTDPESRIFYFATRITLSENGIELEQEQEPFISPSEFGLRAELDGIYLNDELIVPNGQSVDELDGDNSEFIAVHWVLGKNAVIYEASYHNVFLFDEETEILQPILLLEIPPEYEVTNTPVSLRTR